MELIDYIQDNLPIIIWGAIILVSLLLELESCTLNFIWFAISGIISLILHIFGYTEIIQILSFVLFSTLSFFLIGRFIKVGGGKNFKTNIDAYIGKEVEIEKILDKDSYEVKLEGKYWSAVASNKQTFNVGDNVCIVKVSGNKLIIK